MQDIKQAILYLHEDCPYECSYCLLNSPTYQRQEKSIAATDEGVDKIIHFFRERPDWHLFLTGGEVMLLPRFVELCRRLTQSSFISIDTANSVDGDVFERFVTEIPASRTDFVRCALHEHDEDDEKVEGYIKRVKRMQEVGFSTFVVFIATPDRISRIPEYFKLFRSYGIPFVVAPLLTPEYPKAYTPTETDILDKYMVSAVYRSRMGDFRDSEGKLCNAGHARININCIDGNIRRCWRNWDTIGNIYQNTLKLFDIPQTCSSDFCSIEYEPQLDLEIPFYNDLQNILSLRERYEEALYNEILGKSNT